MARRDLFIHIGASKTGTSSLQKGLWDSVDALADQGVGLPFVGRRAHLDHVVRPFGWVAASGYVKPTRRKQLSDITARLKATKGDRLLMSNEDLCELGPRRIDWLLEACDAAKCDVSIVISARDWASQLPSEYQQFLKHRLTTGYPQFLEEVREEVGSQPAVHFRQRQDIPAMVKRWARDLDPSRVHVIVVPAGGTDPDAVFRHFADVVGYDPTTLARSPAGANASFGAVEAEVYRRLNVALGDRLGDYEEAYYPAVRIPLVSGVLPRKASARLTLPPEDLDWVTRKAERDRHALLASNCRLLGDVDALVPGPDAAAPLPEVTEEEVAAATTEALARLLVRNHRDSRSGR